ncbi:melanoma-associated antigen B10-like [Camelus dromedarius]|uniref:melanoma-associated antigen B10-like n=1 Tax=Camelus dromedarius TaxID=9838 RepID=UPI00311A6B1D
MPWSQKSKLRAHEKHRQAQEKPEDLAGTQATVGVGEEFRSASSPLFKGISESSLIAGSCCNPQVLQRATAVSHTEPTYRDPLDETVVLSVYYLLYKYQMKEPITKADMLRNVIQVYRNHFHEILKRASAHMEMVFGLDLKEVDPYRHIYVLVNKLEISYDAILDDVREVPKTGLVMAILGVIFMNGNCATEELVWEVLNMMGVYAGRKNFICGEPRKLITEDLVQENYLECRQVPNSDPPRYEFLWGPRAHAETSKMKALEFVAKINDMVPTAFPSWYEEAVTVEEERPRARAATKVHTTAMASAHSRAMARSSSCPNKVKPILHFVINKKSTFSLMEGQVESFLASKSKFVNVVAHFCAIVPACPNWKLTRWSALLCNFLRKLPSAPRGTDGPHPLVSPDLEHPTSLRIPFLTVDSLIAAALSICKHAEPVLSCGSTWWKQPGPLDHLTAETPTCPWQAFCVGERNFCSEQSRPQRTLPLYQPWKIPGKADRKWYTLISALGFHGSKGIGLYTEGGALGSACNYTKDLELGMKVPPIPEERGSQSPAPAISPQRTQTGIISCSNLREPSEGTEAGEGGGIRVSALNQQRDSS